MTGLFVGLGFVVMREVGVAGAILMFMLPLSAWLLRGRRAGVFAVGVALGTVPGALIVHDFVWGIAAVGLPMVGVHTALFYGPLAWVLARLSARPRLMLVLTPFICTGVEYVRGEIFVGGYPWYTLAHGWGLIDRFVGGGAASIAGHYFSILLVGTGLLAAIVVGRVTGRTLQHHARPVWRAVPGFLFFFPCLLVFGASLPSSTTFTEHRTLRVAAIQTSMSREDKFAREPAGLWLSHKRWLELTEQAAEMGAELIVWPETMYAGPALDPGTVDAYARSGLFFPSQDPRTPARIFLAAFHDDLLATSAKVKVPILIGSLAFENYALNLSGPRPEPSYTKRYNSVFLVENGRVSDLRYDKRRLMPFGEYIPLLQHIPGAVQWLRQKVAPTMPLDCNPGERFVEFPITGALSGGVVRVVTPICFEAMYGSSVRQMVYRDGARVADLLVNISNDNWFGTSSRGRRGHRDNAAWRCVETGLPMVRAVNTGLSCVISPEGRVIHDRLVNQPQGVNELTEGVMIFDVPIPDASWTGTVYGRIGDIVPMICLGVTALAFFIALVGPRRWARQDAARTAAPASTPPPPSGTPA